MRLGEIERYVRIAAEYGERLATPNVKPETISKLVARYPSHDFVIDRREARSLFEIVRNADDEMEGIGDALRDKALKEMYGEPPEFAFLNDEPSDTAGLTETRETHEAETRHDAAEVDHGAGGERTAEAGGQIRPDHGKSGLPDAPDAAAD